MAIVDVIMPQMGESIAEGTITKWYKKVGDKIAKDETLLEISTDKVDSEIPSPSAGLVAELLFPEQKTVDVHTVIARIQTDVHASLYPGPYNLSPGPKTQCPRSVYRLALLLNRRLSGKPFQQIQIDFFLPSS